MIRLRNGAHLWFDTVVAPDALQISECIFDMAALSKLKDSILDMIRIDPNPRLDPARDILKRMDRRELYSCCGAIRYDRCRDADLHSKSEEDILRELVAISRRHVGAGGAAGTQASHGYGTLQTQESLHSTDMHGGNGSSGSSGGGTGTGIAAVSTEHADDNDDDLEGNSFSQMSQNEYRFGGNLSSQDSNMFPPGSQDSNISCQSMMSSLWPEDPPLNDDDIIVEKQHMHHGLGEKNPVSQMRFLRKIAYFHAPNYNLEQLVAYGHREKGFMIPENMYDHRLMRSFETLAIRVFCRNKAARRTARKAFEEWCRTNRVTQPFPSSPFPEGNGHSVMPLTGEYAAASGTQPSGPVPLSLFSAATGSSTGPVNVRAPRETNN